MFYKEALQYWRGKNHKQIFSISEYMHDRDEKFRWISINYSKSNKFSEWMTKIFYKMQRWLLMMLAFHYSRLYLTVL